MDAAPVKIQFDPASETPAVRQISDSLRVLLVNEKLTPGSELPSVRRLAMELGVHFNTVAEAYRLLSAEGWLDLQHGRRAQVLNRTTPEISRTDWVSSFRNRLRGLIAQMRTEGAPLNEIASELRQTAKEITR